MKNKLHSEKEVNAIISRGALALVKVKMTPDWALRLLEKNFHNRALRQTTVNDYTNAMRRGEWKADNGMSILVDVSGELANGQHRLFAAAEFGKPIEMLMTVGVAKDAFETVDVGAKRTAGDMFGVHGEKNSVMLAAALKLLYKYLEGTVNRSSRVTHAQLKKVLGNHGPIRDSVAMLQSLSPQRGLVNRVTVMVIHYVATHEGLEIANDFVRSLVSGENLTKSDPVFQLRSKLLAQAVSRENMTSQEHFVLTVKTWNKYAEGKKMGRTPFWKKGEDIPVILGEPLKWTKARKKLLSAREKDRVRKARISIKKATAVKRGQFGTATSAKKATSRK